MTDPSKLTGSLEALSLTGLLQLLAAEARTGCLEIVSRPCSGSLWIEGGKLVHAATETSEGSAALDALVGLAEGTFSFSPGEEPPLRTLQGPTEQLLMEAAVRNDHAKRDPTHVLEPGCVPSFAPVPEGGSTPRFTTLQWRVLAAIDGRKTLQAIADEIQLPVVALAALLAELESAGVIQVT